MYGKRRSFLSLFMGATGPASPPPPPDPDPDPDPDPPDPPPAVPVGGLGFNMGPLAEYLTAQPFANRCKIARPWVAGTGFNAGSPAPLNAAGYPTAVPSGQDTLQSVFDWRRFIAGVESNAYIDALNATRLGRYHLLWSGDAVLSVRASGSGDGITTVSTGVHSSGQNIVTFDITAPVVWAIEAQRADSQAGPLTLSDTRLYSAADFAIQYAETPPATEAELVYSRRYLDALTRYAPIAALRFMEPQGINNSLVETVDDLPTPESYTVKDAIPLEWAAALCNYFSAELRVCSHHRADDALIDNQAATVLASLDAGLGVLIEDSNETWNSAFEQYDWYAGLTLRNFTGTSGTGTISVADGTAGGEVTLTVTGGLPSQVAGASRITIGSDPQHTYRIATYDDGAGTITLDFGGHFGPALTDEPFWFGEFEFEAGYVMQSGRLADRWRAVWGAQAGRIRVGLGTQRGTNVAATLRAPDGWDGRFNIDAKFDALLTTTYFAGDIIKVESVRNAILLSYRTDTVEATNKLIRDVMLDDHPTLSIPSDLYSIFDNIRDKDLAQALAAGWTLETYEGGSAHSVQRFAISGVTDEDFIDSWLAHENWLQSSYAYEVHVNHWALCRAILTGPMVHFNFGKDRDQFGIWGLEAPIGYPDQRQAAYLAEIVKPRWYGADALPQWPLTIPQLTFKRGLPVSASSFALYASQNADSFSAALLPAGVTVAADGTLGGTPSEITPRTLYAIAATNTYGTSNANASIEVIDFTPPDLTQPEWSTVLAFDASLAGQITHDQSVSATEGVVSAITDFSGAGSDLIEVVGTGPTTGAETLNGRNVLSSPLGVNTGIRTSDGALAALLDGSNAFSYSALVYADAVDKYAIRVGRKNSAPQEGFQVFFGGFNLTIKLADVDSDNTINFTGDFSGQWVLIQARWDGATLWARANGKEKSIPIAQALPWASTGDDAKSGFWLWQGKHATFSLHSAALTDEQLEDIRNGYTLDWGFSEPTS